MMDWKRKSRITQKVSLRAMAERVPRIGEVWDVIFDPVQGHEQGGRRPALVISIDQFNRARNGLCIVVPITRTNRGIRAQLPVEPPEGGLSSPSVIMCDQVRSVSIARLQKRRGLVRKSTLERVQETVGLLIGR